MCKNDTIIMRKNDTIPMCKNDTIYCVSLTQSIVYFGRNEILLCTFDTMNSHQADRKCMENKVLRSETPMRLRVKPQCV